MLDLFCALKNVVPILVFLFLIHVNVKIFIMPINRPFCAEYIFTVIFLFPVAMNIKMDPIKITNTVDCLVKAGNKFECKWLVILLNLAVPVK
jgi:hypothetical protein